MMRKTSFRYVKDVILYPTELGVAIWYQPRRLLSSRSPIQLNIPEEYCNRPPYSLITKDYRWNVPFFFHIYDVSMHGAEDFVDWQKMQAIDALEAAQRRSASFLAPWMPLAIYEAHRRNIYNLLLTEEHSLNTFYVGQGINVFAKHIYRKRNHEEKGGKESWWTGAEGIGDEGFHPIRQRIFVG